MNESEFKFTTQLDAARPTSRFSSESSAVDPRDTAATTTTILGSAPPRVAEGLLHLLEAHDYAVDVDTDIWDFALDLRELRDVGLTNTDLRWLALKGLVECARETTLPGDTQRAFRKLNGVSFTKHACFVISSSGVKAARAMSRTRHADDATKQNERLPASDASSQVAARVAPHWDADLQELRVNGVVVKQFKVPAPNQEMVLAAFEEEHWPARVDDPLPPQADQDPKRRLHDTIVSLNRNHKARLIRFMGDGSGEGVRWTIITDKQQA